MPAVSKKQRKAAGMAYAAKKGEFDPSELRGSAKEMYQSMGKKDLRKFAKTKEKGLPVKKEHTHFEEWLKERDPDMVNEVGTTTADVALFKRMTIPSTRRQFAPNIAFGEEDDFFKKKNSRLKG